MSGSGVWFQVSGIASHLLHVNNARAPNALPLLTPSPRTAGWFAKNNKFIFFFGGQSEKNKKKIPDHFPIITFL